MAQKEFHEKIKERRNLTDRINTYYEIRPLDRNETQDMIQFRLRKAGWTKNRPLFSSKAIDRIYHYSGGYPRRIITLCHHSLLFMLIRKSDIVEPGMVEHAISQLYEYKEESSQTRHASISNTVIRYNSPKTFICAKLMHAFPLKRLINPVLSVIILLLLLLTVFWGTRNMNWSNLNDKTPSIKKSFVSSKLRTQDLDNKKLGVQKLDIQKLGAQMLITQELVKQQKLSSQTLGIQGFGRQRLDSKVMDSRDQDTNEQNTPEQDTQELNMESFPVHAFENTKTLNLNTIFSDIPESSSGSEIKKNHDISPNSGGVPMIASEGDTVFKLARKVYNIDINTSILKKIHQSNPHISNLDHIKVGDKIFFPKLLFSQSKEVFTESFINP